MPAIPTQPSVASRIETNPVAMHRGRPARPGWRMREDTMAEIKTGLGWTEAQWERVNNAVTEAFGKASVAGAFLPCYGPLPEAAEYVREETFTDTGAKVRVEDDTTLKLFNLTVKVELSSEQVNDDGLSSALLAFRRAANTLAQVEDHLVFNGRGEAPETEASARLGKALPDNDSGGMLS